MCGWTRCWRRPTMWRWPPGLPIPTRRGSSSTCSRRASVCTRSPRPENLCWRRGSILPSRTRRSCTFASCTTWTSSSCGAGGPSSAHPSAGADQDVRTAHRRGVTNTSGATGGSMDAAYGSDLIVDGLRALGIEYAALNPGATFRGLHDSLVNYGGNAHPGIIQCCHEEIAVAVAHGYAKAAGRPMAAILHDVVGLQHASMAIFNAWCDQAPVLVLGGTGPMAADRRRPWIDWIHTALVQGQAVRDYVKWDDQPASVPAIPEALV